MKSNRIDWNHAYSFVRIISKCIKNNETYLINSEIFSTKYWISALLISLFLNQENSTFVLSDERIDFLQKNQIIDLKNLGFKFTFENNQIIFSTHRIYLITLNKFLTDPKFYGFKNHRIIFSGIESIKADLKNHFRITLLKKDWLCKVGESGKYNKNLISTYNSLKKKFFLRKLLGNSYLLLDKEEVSYLSNFFAKNASFSNIFSKVSKALSKGWACWIKFDNTNLEWDFLLEPIDELSEIKELLANNKFIF